VYYRLCDKPESLDRPAGVPKDHVPVYKYGGGFICWVDLTQFVKTTLPEGMQPGYARFEDGPFHACLCNPYDRWNGWAKPHFSKEVFNDILKETHMEIKQTQEEEEEDYRILYVHEIDDEVEELYDHQARVYHSADDTDFFDGWCWDFYTEEEKQQVERDQADEILDEYYETEGSLIDVYD
jgi:hypothetical protein